MSSVTVSGACVRQCGCPGVIRTVRCWAAVSGAEGAPASFPCAPVVPGEAVPAKLREVSATYTLPERWLRKRASITLAGRELKTWTDYRGLDPESNVNNAATTAQTIDQATTPNLMRFIATFNISW